MQDDPRPSHRKVRLLRRWAFLAALLLPLAAGAQQAATDTHAGTHPDRPRTCLVLGGGGVVHRYSKLSRVSAHGGRETGAISSL